MSSFDAARARALDRLASLSPMRVAFVGLLGGAGIGVGLLSGFPVGVVPLLVFGTSAFFTWRGAQKSRRELHGAVTAAARPDLWFHTDATGLFFLDQRGIFIERRREFLPWAPKRVDAIELDGTPASYETRIASVSYEEAAHALKLQLVRVGISGNGREDRSSMMVPLPKDVTPQLALQLAIESNRRAARDA